MYDDMVLIRYNEDGTLKMPTNVIDNGYGVYFCEKCGGTVWQIKDESHYCFRCGEKLIW